MHVTCGAGYRFAPIEKAPIKYEAISSWGKINLGAGCGVAVREFPLKTGYADYLLFVDQRAIGAIEAKAERTMLTGGVGVIQ